jgi:hypothetical protein
MKAVRFNEYGDVDVVEVVEVPDPVPGEGKVLVRVKAARINPGEAAGGRLDALIDTFGRGHVGLAIELGVAPDRIDTIIDMDAAARHGVKTDGNAEGASEDRATPLIQRS